MLNKLDQYLIRQFWVLLGLSILGFVSIFVIVDLIENMDRFMDNNVPSKIVIQYYVYTMPWFVSIGLPMSMLISTVFSLGSMVKRNEWTAMKASGISLYRVVIPFLLVSSCVSIGSFYLDNSLVSWGNEKKAEIKGQYMNRKSVKSKNKQLSLLEIRFLDYPSSKINLAYQRTEKYLKHLRVMGCLTIYFQKE